nr:unnamed protein product [Spirometra erinaceieuropaei]
MQQRNFAYPAITSVIWFSLIFVCQPTLSPKSPSARTVDVIEIEQPHQLRSVQCELKPGQQLLSVLPGSGWDNLVNEERGLTTDRETYTLCRISSDGKLLLPDDNVNRGLIVRSQLRHRIYAVHQLPDSNLHPRFRNRLLDIAAHLEASNSTQQSNRSTTARDVVMQTGESVGKHFGALVDNIRAAYLADLIVRDYGTHTVMSVEAGAVIAKVDSLSGSSRLLSASDRLKLKASASSSFMDFFSISSRTSTSNVDQSVEKYNSMVSASTVISHGGMHLKASDLNISVWEDTIESNLVAIDRRGRLIYDLITPRTLPELTETMALRLAGVIKAAVERYYAANTVVDSPGLFQASWAKRCPTGYTSHLAVIEDICQVNYCTPANSIKVVQERRLHRPPFIQLPELTAHNVDPVVEKIVNGPRFFKSASGHHYQNVNGQWLRAPAATSSPFSDGWAVASLVLAVCLCIFLLAALFVWRLRRRGVLRRAPVRSITSTA